MAIRDRIVTTLYPRLLEGAPMLGTPAQMLTRHRRQDGSLKLQTMINHYSVLSGSTGFVTGLPGFLMLPVTWPADLVGNLSIQLHLTMTIALAGGHDPAAPEVREQVVDCVFSRIDGEGSNSGEEEVARRTASKLGEWALRFSIKRAAKAANSRLGFRRIPVIGGVIAGGSDFVMTRHIASCARSRFLASDAELQTAE